MNVVIESLLESPNMKRIWIITFVLLLPLIAVAQKVCGSGNKCPNDSVSSLLADFDSVVSMTEHDYAPYKYKVTNKNQKEYVSFKQGIIRDITTGKRSWRDAVCAYVGWFGDFHFFVFGDQNDHYQFNKYQRKRIDYSPVMEYAPKAVSCQVDTHTWLIRFPTCEGSESLTEFVENSIRQYRVSGCPYLIIDIRGNGGGQDETFEPYLHLLYDTPGWIGDGVVFRNTASNIQRSGWTHEDFLDLFHIDELNSGEYITRIKDGIPVTYDTIYARPVKAALIIDNCVASSGEQMVLDIRKASRRTKIFGRDHTLGCIDTGNCQYFIFAKHQIGIHYPTTYSTRFDHGTGVDTNGISPDIHLNLPYPKRLSDNIDEWVLWTAMMLEK